VPKGYAKSSSSETGSVSPGRFSLGVACGSAVLRHLISVRKFRSGVESGGAGSNADLRKFLFSFLFFLFDGLAYMGCFLGNVPDDKKGAGSE
jgi:hypothetical protein